MSAASFYTRPQNSAWRVLVLDFESSLEFKQSVGFDKQHESKSDEAGLEPVEDTLLGSLVDG